MVERLFAWGGKLGIEHRKEGLSQVLKRSSRLAVVKFLASHRSASDVQGDTTALARRAILKLRQLEVTCQRHDVPICCLKMDLLRSTQREKALN